MPHSEYFFAVGFGCGILVTFILWRLVPESVRYLNVVKKEKTAMKILQSLAKSTRKQSMIQKYAAVEISEEDADREKEVTLPLKTLLRYFVRSKKHFAEICIIALIWFANIF